MPAPAATVVTTTAAPSTGTEGIGKTILIKVKMSRAVTVSGGTPELLLDDGGIAQYVSGSGSAVLVFSYQVSGSDTSEPSLSVTNLNPNGATIDDSTSHPADFSNVATTFGSLAIDTAIPSITGATTVPASGDEGVGKIITIRLTFSEAVKVTGGLPTLLLNDGGAASYKSGSNTNTLVFTYQVGAGDSSVAALQITGNLLNGATIASASGNVADLSGADVTFSNIQIDTVAPTVLSAATNVVSGDEGPGKTITISLTFSEAVKVANGDPVLELNDGGFAYYKNGSGTNTLNFTYQVSSSDSSVAALAITAFDLDGSSVTDKAGNNADLTNAPATFIGLEIDTTPPTVFSVQANPTTGNETIGKTVTFTVDFDEAVTVKGGKPLLELNDGGVATYKSGSGTDTLTFTYKVSANETSVSSLAIVGASTNGATVADTLGNAADFSNADAAFAGLKVTATPASYSFFTIADPSGSTTIATGLNDLGQIVGNYRPSGGGVFSGFLYNGGSYSDLNQEEGQTATGINDAGQIVGSFDYNGTAGYVQNLDGSDFTTLIDPNESGYFFTTSATGITNNGEVVGNYQAYGNYESYYYNDFSGSGPIYADVTVPRGGDQGSFVAGENSFGSFVGYYIDNELTAHGYIVHGGEATIQLDDPNASQSYGEGTVATGINDLGQVVGYYFDNNGVTHGFLYQNGSYTTINDTNAAGGTVLQGINNAGQMVGAAGGEGFVATPGIDLTTIAFSATTTLAYAPNSGNTGGTITVSDGTHQATINVIGQFAAADFHTANDFSGGTYVTDPTLGGAALTTFLASQHT